MTTPPRLRPIHLVLSIVAVLVAGGCTTAGIPASTAPSLPPSTAPSLPPSDDPSVAPGGGSDGSIGSGIVDPGQVAPADPGGQGQAQLVIPKPGQKDPHPVAPIKLESSIDGRHVLVKVSWYGGVEPCSVLDSVKVDRSGTDIAITPLEGIGDPDAMCIEIAVLKATIVDLGDLEPGTYRITAPTGDAPALEITIS